MLSQRYLSEGRKLPQILPAAHQDIEGVELHLIAVLSAVEPVEVGDAVDA
jgi:hypothetical protein